MFHVLLINCIIFSSYRTLVEDLLSKFTGLTVSVCSILPREWNFYDRSSWNKLKLPMLQKNIVKLNHGLQTLVSRYQRSDYLDYGLLFLPALHLGRDGLHVNRDGALTLKMVFDGYMAEEEFEEEIVPLPATATPTTEDSTPYVKTYSDVVKELAGDHHEYFSMVNYF